MSNEHKAEQRPTSSKVRDEALDGLRGLAALCVFVVHIYLYTRVSGRAEGGTAALVLWQVRIGLIAFFIMSGHLLYMHFARAARKQEGPYGSGPYLIRRATRILPGYYLAMLGTLALLGPIQGEPNVRWPADSYLPLYAVFGQNYSSETVMQLNPVTWTLSLEVAFYLMLPLFGWFAYHVARGRWWPQLALFGAIVVAGFGWRALAFYEEWSQIGSKFIIAYLPYFAIGMAVAVVVDKRHELRELMSARATTLLMVAGFALVVLNQVWHSISAGPRTDAWIAIVHDMPAGVGFGLVVACCVLGTGWTLAPFKALIPVWLGVISYAWYLWQLPLILFLASFDFVSLSFLPMLIIATPICLGAGALSWYLLEKPLLVGVNARLRARKQRRASVVTT